MQVYKTAAVMAGIFKFGGTNESLLTLRSTTAEVESVRLTCKTNESYVNTWLSDLYE